MQELLISLGSDRGRRQSIKEIAYNISLKRAFNRFFDPKNSILSINMAFQQCSCYGLQRARPQKSNVMVLINMEEFEFEIEDIFNISPSKGATKAFAGKVLSGIVNEGDRATLLIDGHNFQLTVVWCEVFRKKQDKLTPEDGLSAICATIDVPDKLKDYL